MAMAQPYKVHTDSVREDLQQLHVPDDGVHLSLQGHQLMAEFVLDYLSKTNSK